METVQVSDGVEHRQLRRPSDALIDSATLRPALPAPREIRHVQH